MLDNDDHVSGLILEGDMVLSLPDGYVTDTWYAFDSVDEWATEMEEGDIHDVGNEAIKQFFYLAPRARLWVFFKSGAESVISVEDYLSQTGGKVRQFGFFAASGFPDLVADIAPYTTFINALHGVHCPAVAVVGANGSVDFASGTELVAMNVPWLSMIGTTETELERGDVGIVLGALAKGKVHECVGWVERFNVFYANRPITAIATGNLEAAGVIAQVTYPGLAGTYLSTSRTAVAATDDLATLELNRVMHKVHRGVYTALLPKVNSPLYVNSDTGKLDAVTIGDFESVANRPLSRMLVDGELSGYRIFINPDQNVLSTSKIEVEVRAVPVGVANEISVTIGLTTRL